MKTRMDANSLTRSILAGIGMTLLYILIGVVLDYAITQVLSQFIIPDCSEDCYFGYFNTIFVVVVLLSVAGGIRSGVRTYRELSTE